MTEKVKTPKELRAEKHQLREQQKFEKRRKEQQRYRRRSIVPFVIQNSLIVVVLAPLLWWLAFMWYPLSTMVDVSGTITESGYYSTRGRFSSTLNYLVKLDGYESPLRFKKTSELLPFIAPLPKLTPNPARVKPIPDGTKVTVQIQRNDLEKLHDGSRYAPLNDFPGPKLSEVPRMYGIIIDDKVLIKPARALWNSSTPFFVDGIFRLLVIFAEFWVIMRLCSIITKKGRDKMFGFN